MTVVVVVYNHGRYINDLFASIEQQTRSPSNLIICDDCSSDNSRELIEQFASASSLDIELMFNRRNLGLTRTLNNALAKVTTPYFAYISGDDLMEPKRLEIQVSAIEGTTPRPAFVYSDAFLIDEAGNRSPGTFIDAYMQGRSIVNSFTELLNGNWIPAPSVLANTQAVRLENGYDESLFFEDHDLWLRLARRHPFAGIDSPLVSFRQLTTSLGSRRFRDDNDEWHRAKVRIYSKHLGINSRVDKHLVALIKPRLITLAARGESPKYLAPHFRSILRSDPSPSNALFAMVSTAMPRALRPLARSRRRA